ncbi:MAG: hypothetical protein QG602_658 [Verrucomicrobiota bacterium]|nr:hypothetical protein [Verrucomicrobiota bacterium]
MLFNNRNSRQSLLIEVNPYQILAAGIDRPDTGPVTIEVAAEFDRSDAEGLRDWLATHFEKQTSWLPAIAGFVPPEALLHRESIVPRRLSDPGYLPDLVQEQYKIENPAAWKLLTLSPLEGEQVAPEGTQRPVLVCGVSHTNVQAMQQQLLDQRLLPYRLELGILPLLGAIAGQQKRSGEKRAVVVVVIEQEHTVAFIIGKEGVHTPAPVRHGFSSIVQAARREFNLDRAEDIRDRLHQDDDELLLRGSKFVRSIGRDLKPLVDSYEMTTGQPVGEIYCAYLPPALSWIAEPLAQVIGRSPLVLDCAAWQASVGINAAEDLKPLGQHWLGALSLVAQPEGAAEATAAKPDAAYQGPWRVDCRISAALPSGDLVRRRFVTNAIAATLATAALVFTVWLTYLGRTLEAEISGWQQRIADNKRQVDALDADTRALGAAATRIDSAHALMAMPYSLSELLMALGRNRPANMQIDSIDSLQTGLVLRGSLHEPSDRAKLTLDQCRQQMLKDPLIGTRFTSIGLTSFSRRVEADTFDFELSFKLKEAKP